MPKKRISPLGLLILGLMVWAGSLLSATAGEQSTTLITGDEIKKMNAGSVPDVLNQLPGISASDTYVSIRGSYKVKVFIDGNSINDPTSTSGQLNGDPSP